MADIALTGLVKISLRSGPVIRLCDGGAIRWGAEDFISEDPTFGTIGSIDALGDGLGGEVPALQLGLLPPSTTAAAVLAAPGNQQSPAKFWLAEYNRATGALVGTPAMLFNGLVDQQTLTVGRSSRGLAMSIVSVLERFFELNIGNSMNASFHKSVWPGELGHDNATGLGRPVAWGVESPQGYSTGGGGGGVRFIDRGLVQMQ